MPQQQTSAPGAVRGRGRGGTNVVVKRGGRQGTPPPQDLQPPAKKAPYQKPAQQEANKDPIKVEPNPFPIPSTPYQKFMK